MNQELVRKYRSGKLPAGIWLYSCLAGAVVAGVESVVLWDNSFNGAWAGMFLRVFIGNLLYTLPVFFAQAHFVAIALQKKKGKARPVQALVLACSITCAVFVVLLLQSGTKVNHEEYVYFSWTNFSAIALCWVMMSFFSIRGAE